MKYNIDEDALKLLLEKRKKYINSRYKVLDLVAWAVIFLQSVRSFFVETNKLFLAIEILILLISLTVSIYICIKLRDKFGIEKLLKEIADLNNSPHEHCLIVIKDTYNNYPNRFLLYYEPTWDCEFFPNLKTNSKNKTNSIATKLSNELKLSAKDISVKFVTESIHSKYSFEHQMERRYKHKLYIATINNFTDNMKATRFEIDGKQYHWMTIQEMENSPNIKKKNAEVVEFVKVSMQSE